MGLSSKVFFPIGSFFSLFPLFFSFPFMFLQMYQGVWFTHLSGHHCGAEGVHFSPLFGKGDAYEVFSPLFFY